LLARIDRNPIHGQVPDEATQLIARRLAVVFGSLLEIPGMPELLLLHLVP